MATLADCLKVDPKDFDFDGGLQLVIAAFTKIVGQIPILAPQFFIKGPSVIIDAFLGALSPSLPSFNVDVPGIGNLKFEGKDLNANFGLPVFAPDGLIKMIVGMVKILLGLPELFFDKGPPPVPKVPTFDAVLKLVGASLGLQVDPLILNADFIKKFSGCIAKIILP